MTTLLHHQPFVRWSSNSFSSWWFFTSPFEKYFWNVRQIGSWNPFRIRVWRSIYIYISRFTSQFCLCRPKVQARLATCFRMTPTSNVNFCRSITIVRLPSFSEFVRGPDEISELEEVFWVAARSLATIRRGWVTLLKMMTGVLNLAYLEWNILIDGRARLMLVVCKHWRGSVCWCCWNSIHRRRAATHERQMLQRIHRIHGMRD